MSERKPSPFKTLLDSDVCTLIEAAARIIVTDIDAERVKRVNNYQAQVKKLQFNNGQLDNANFGVLPRDNKFGRRIVQLAFKMYF